MATHSSTLAWKIPWTEEPGRLQSMGSQRVGNAERLHFHFHPVSGADDPSLIRGGLLTVACSELCVMYSMIYSSCQIRKKWKMLSKFALLI